ncbi:MAG: lactonase family protein, partial [Proteobacteria bacterium]|nr:lactonase family protein [Pseudomonadota bacterium]
MRATRPNGDTGTQTQRPSRSGRLAFVGSFTTRSRGARGKGISVYDVRTVGGRWSEIFRVEEPVNPSFLIADPNRSILYAVHGDERHASAYAIDRGTGELYLINRTRTGGLNGVHLSLDPTGQFLIVANHDSGSLGVLALARDGSLGNAIQILDLPGALGPHREQFSTQPHQVMFDPSARFVIVPCKGTDRVFVLAFDARRGRLSLHGDGAVMRPGAGPRHAAFHPGAPFLFVVNEIDSSITVCGWDESSGSIAPLGTALCLPPNTSRANTASAIIVTRDGRHIYVSNRGDDSIAHFSFDAR